MYKFFLFLGLCPECSIKLNYRSQKREIKRNKGVKRLQQHELKNKLKSDASSSKTEDVIHEDNDVTEKMEIAQISEEKTEDESNVWKANQEITEKSREEEFEEYLADLLL